MAMTGLPPLQSLPSAARWAVLLAASIAVTALLQWVKLPAAFLLGPAAAALMVQTRGGAVTVPRFSLIAAQAVLGCLVAHTITPSIVDGFLYHWPSVLGVLALSITASIVIGWIMGRFRIIPGSTPIWGMLPGGATVMMVMAEAYGADFRLVAFMQYLRVVLVAAAGSLLALYVAHGGVGRFANGYFPPVDAVAAAATVALALVGAWLGFVFRIPAGALMGPLALGGVLNALGLVKIELPPVVLIASFAIIGWNVGLRFTRDVLAAAARALPQTVGAITLLMMVCGLLAWMLVEFLHVDPLTAYLATSPGGVDAAAIISASTNVDMPFVMALQTTRLVVLIVIGPPLARWAAGKLDRRSLRPRDPAKID
jgi:uncharacterized protein